MKKHFVAYFALALLALLLCSAGGQETSREQEQSAGTQTRAAAPAAGSGNHEKHALVIGNGAYTSITKLNNPVNDARDMEAALKELGFSVDLIVNGTLEQMENAATRFKNRLSVSKNAYGFFYYAGHGVQFNGQNYLIPVNANITSGNYLGERAVSVQVMLDELNDAGNELNIVVLDACRDNPFSWGRGGNRGLSVVPGQPADSIIVKFGDCHPSDGVSAGEYLNLELP